MGQHRELEPTPELNSAEKGSKTEKNRKKEVGKAGGQQPQPCQGRHPENTKCQREFPVQHLCSCPAGPQRAQGAKTALEGLGMLRDVLTLYRSISSYVLILNGLEEKGK